MSEYKENKSNLDTKGEMKYFIHNVINYCYPSDVSRETKEYGVLSKYMGKLFNKDEMDKIICELIINHPYVNGSMWLDINICRTYENVEEHEFYHILNIKNDNWEQQVKGSLEIEYENHHKNLEIADIVAGV